MTDPIADLLTRIRNAELARHLDVTIPYSKMKEAILKVMVKHGFVMSYEVVKDADSKFNNLKVVLSKKPYKSYYKRASKPGQRTYVSAGDIKPVKNGLGISILSTSKGVMSNVDARKENVGGEILCEVW